MMGQEAAMQARKTLFPILTLVLAVFSVSPGRAQDIFSDVDWASTKQEMKDFGMQYENAGICIGTSRQRRRTELWRQTKCPTGVDCGCVPGVRRIVSTTMASFPD